MDESNADPRTLLKLQIESNHRQAAVELKQLLTAYGVELEAIITVGGDVVSVDWLLREVLKINGDLGFRLRNL